MNELAESILYSLDGGQDPRIYSYLPFLLQDLWELGTSAESVIQLIKKHKTYLPGEVHVLDLGCGKGAVSVRLALEFGFQCRGIDGMPEFIRAANHWAQHYQVQTLCGFECGDIRNWQPGDDLYDIIILGSIGSVFGSPQETLRQVKQFTRPSGLIMIADAYIPDDQALHSPHPQYYYRKEIIRAIQDNHLKVLEEHPDNRSDAVRDNEKMYALIESRARELSEKYPDKQDIFSTYLREQQKENEILDNEVMSVTWLLRER
jgi:2-polyprenyl-3-methyl-5-hydroxy-6-metoxy-1,4-benzoquinol methylase